MKLYLMRHAQSADKQPGQSDKERELTPEGMRQSLRMGAFLHAEKIIFDFFLSSTAIRAKSTAEYVLESLQLPAEKIVLEDELYNASIRTLYSQLLALDRSFQSVMLIGHNPSISYLAEYLTKKEIGDMVPAGMTIIQFNHIQWNEIREGSGELVRYIYPEML